MPHKIYLFTKTHWDDILAATLAFKEHIVEANWLEFVNHINSVIDEFVPSKLSSTRHNLRGVDCCLKASGPDGIPCRVLQSLAFEVAPILHLIFEQSLAMGSFWSDWCKAHNAPIFKKGNVNLAENYRPVSPTSVSCMIMEHIICSHIHKHLDRHSILSKFQHGFRCKHSCEAQLLITTHDLASLRDKGTQVDMAILDFSKAFDTIPHNKLLHKLKKYSIGGSIHAWWPRSLNRGTSVS